MDTKQLRHLAELAKLRLTPAQEERAGAQIERLLRAFEVLQLADTSGVEPSPYPRQIGHRTRPDQPRPGLDPEEVIANADEHRAGCIRVPRVVEG